MTRREWRAHEALRLSDSADNEDEQTVALPTSTEPVLELGPSARVVTHPLTPSHGLSAVHPGTPVSSPNSAGHVIDLRDGHVPKARPSIRPGEQGRFVTRGSARPAPPLSDLAAARPNSGNLADGPVQPQVLERAVPDEDDDDEVDTMFVSHAEVVSDAQEQAQTGGQVLATPEVSVQTGGTSVTSPSPAATPGGSGQTALPWTPPNAWDAAQAELAAPVSLPAAIGDDSTPTACDSLGLPVVSSDVPVIDRSIFDDADGSAGPVIPAVSRSTDVGVGTLPPPLGQVPVATGFHTSTDTGSTETVSVSSQSTAQARSLGPVTGQNLAPPLGYTGVPPVVGPRLTSVAVDDDDETAAVETPTDTSAAQTPSASDSGLVAESGASEDTPVGSLPRYDGSLHDFAEATERRLRAEQRESGAHAPSQPTGAYEPVTLRSHWTYPVAGVMAGITVVCSVAAILVAGTSMALQIMLGVIAALSALVTCRLPFVRVFLAPDALHAHGLWSSVTAFRVGVQRAAVADMSDGPLGPRRAPEVHLTNGQRLKLTMLNEMEAGPLAFGSRPAMIPDQVAHINAWLAAHGHTEALEIVKKR